MCLYVQKAHTNNSALGGHRVVPKVANERYCYIVFIIGVFYAQGTYQKNQKKQTFFGMHLLHAHVHKKRLKKSKLYSNTFHLPPSGPFRDHLVLSYWNAPFCVHGRICTNKNTKNLNYITKPFICHLLEHSVTSQIWVFFGMHLLHIHTLRMHVHICAQKNSENQNYIAIPFICHLWDCSVTTQSWVIGP